MRHVVVNHIVRVGSTCIKEIEIGGKILNTIGTLPKLQSRKDLELFFGRSPSEMHTEGVVLDLWNLHELSKSLFIGEGQRRLDNNEIAITRAKEMMDEKAIIIDPSSEEYSYPRLHHTEKDKKNRENKGRKVNRVDLIFSLSKFPTQVRDVFKDRKPNDAWHELESRKLILVYVDWYVRHCLSLGASVILPPVPLVDGRKQAMLNTLAKVNAVCHRITVETTVAYPATYVPIDSTAFQSDKPPQRIADAIADMLQPHSILVLKFFRTEDMLADPMARRRLRVFLMALDTLKREHHDTIAIMVLDTRNEGLAYFGNGVDLTCDPLGGVQDRPKFRKKKKQDEGDDDIDEEEDFGIYGKWYHPELRHYLKMDQVKESLGENGQLPHNCEFCDGIGDSLTREADDPSFPTSAQWNSGRRTHNYTCRQEEDQLVKDSVRAGERRAVELYLNKSTRADKNLLDLLP